MDFLKWLVGGLIGAAIGGIVWVAVGYFLDAEVGYIAWGIGFLAGLGVRIVAGEDEGVMCGIAGVIAAVLVIAGSKYMVISLYVDKLMVEELGDVDSPMTEEDLVTRTADEIAANREMAGEAVNWRPGMDYENAENLADYPADIVEAAREQVAAMPADERQNTLDLMTQQRDATLDIMKSTITDMAFKESFNAFDLLWFGLAAFTAFRLGGGVTEQ